MIAIQNGTLITITQGVIEQGTILVDQGRITALGSGIAVPDGAQVIDAAGKYVTPGFIDAHTHIALINEPQCRPVTYDANELTNPCTPFLHAMDAFNPFDPSIGIVRAAGFTTCYTGPGSANVIGGLGFAFKLKQSDNVADMMLPGTEMMKFALGHNPKNIYGTQKKTPGTRMGIAALLREQLTNAREYSDALAQAERDQTKPPKRDFRLDPLVPVVRGERKVRIHCHRNDDVLTAIRISEEFGLDYCIEHVTEGWMIREYLAKKGCDMVLGPLTLGYTKPEVWNITIKNPALLEQAGITNFSLMEDAGSETRNLPFHIGLCIAHGLSMETAYRAVTINPARMLGIADRVGSLEVGKDADLAIWSGNPFCNFTLCEKTIIDGVVYENEDSVSGRRPVYRVDLTT